MSALGKILSAAVVIGTLVTIAFVFVLGYQLGQPTDAELNSSAHDLCQELGGNWRTDFNGGWCKI